MRRERELRRAAPIAQGGFVLLENRGSDERIDPEPRGARDQRKAAVEKHITAVAREDIALVASLLEELRDLARPVEPARRRRQSRGEVGPAVEHRVKDVVVLDLDDGEVLVERLTGFEALRIELHRSLERGERIAAPSLDVPSDPMQEKQDVHASIVDTELARSQG